MVFAEMNLGSRNRRRQGAIFEFAIIVPFWQDKLRQAMGPLALQGADALVPGFHGGRLPCQVANHHEFEVPDGLELADDTARRWYS